MFSTETRSRWLTIAESLKPVLFHESKTPVAVVQAQRDEAAFQGWELPFLESLSALESRFMKAGESFILDFGEHIVGHFHFQIDAQGAPDAPCRLQLIFGEVPAEVCEPLDPYKGSLSRAWLQDEVVNIDVIPQTVELPRRYAFRYVKVTIVSTSSSYRVRLSDFVCQTVTSADYSRVQPLPSETPEAIRALDEVSLRTLANCMHTVFEDGPKRDRRLWIGDLRLQALANYVSFDNNDLVKRCLYLFAGLAHDDGMVAACIFESPSPKRGDNDILDYAALYVSTLSDYFEATGDEEAARDLWPVAYRQLERVQDYINDEGVFIDPQNWWLFIDWQKGLDKQTPLQGVIIYALRHGAALARRLGELRTVASLENVIERMTQAARRQLFDADSGLFISGSKRQISWASQVWMILAGVVDEIEGARLFEALEKCPDAVTPAGPYLYHYVVDAMQMCGLEAESKALLRSYWGSMLDWGATTFWEVHAPNNALLSPYNSHLINSYCHAWSCTPTYFIRRSMKSQ